jgi:hypothetical protein
MKSAYILFIILIVVTSSGCKKQNSAELVTPSPAATVSAVPSIIPSDRPTSAPDSQPDEISLYPFYEDGNTTTDFGNPMNSKLWGYMDRTGQTVIQPLYGMADPFNAKGIARVSKLDHDNELYGLIDQTGAYVLEPKYSAIDAKDGLFVAALDEKHSTIIGEDGKVIKSDIPGKIYKFSEGKAAYSVGELYGVIDQNGVTIIKPQFRYIEDYQNGKALVNVREGQYTLINDKGALIHKYSAHSMDNFSEGFASVRLTSNAKSGYMNEEGELVISDKFENAEAFHEGLAVVSLNSYENQTGLINTKGEYLLQAQFGEIVYLGKSLWAVSKTNRQMVYDSPAVPLKYALYNQKGEKITDYVFDEVQPFQDNYAVVQQGISSFLIDETGHKTKDWPAVEGIGELKVIKDLIYADVDNELRYISAQGDVVWQGGNSYDLGNGAKLKEVKYRPDRHTLVYYPEIEGLKDVDVQAKINEKFKQEGIPDFNSDEEGQTDYDQSFSVTMFKKNLLIVGTSSYSFSGGAHGMPGERYDHIDLQTGEFYRLSDLFKANSKYVKAINPIIEKQIAEHGEEKGVFQESDLGFQGIQADHLFYIQGEALHIVFTPYEIGPYAAGFITFDIPFKELEAVLDKEGAFWQSFH